MNDVPYTYMLWNVYIYTRVSEVLGSTLSVICRQSDINCLSFKCCLKRHCHSESCSCPSLLSLTSRIKTTLHRVSNLPPGREAENNSGDAWDVSKWDWQDSHYIVYKRRFPGTWHGSVRPDCSTLQYLVRDIQNIQT